LNEALLTEYSILATLQDFLALFLCFLRFLLLALTCLRTLTTCCVRGRTLLMAGEWNEQESSKMSNASLIQLLNVW